MKKPGHIGFNILTYTPVYFLLTHFHNSFIAITGLLIVIFTASFPDIDNKLPLITHRGIIHTPVGLGLFSVILGYIFLQLFTVTTSVAITLLFTFSYFSHLVADTLNPTGIKWLWPIKSKSYTVDFTNYDSLLVNYGLLIGSILLFLFSHVIV